MSKRYQIVHEVHVCNQCEKQTNDVDAEVGWILLGSMSVTMGRTPRGNTKAVGGPGDRSFCTVQCLTDYAVSAWWTTGASHD